MKRYAPAVALVVAALLSLPACVQGSGARRPAAPMDLSQVPSQRSAAPAYAGAPRPLMQPAAPGQPEREARNAATRGQRPGVTAGQRAPLAVAPSLYEPPRLALPPSQPPAPEKKMPLVLPSLQSANGRSR